MPVAPIVAIDVAPDTSPYLATAAVRGCEAALGEGGCVPAEATTAATPWLAEVTGHPERSKPAVTIRLFIDGSTIVYQTRLIEFSRADAERQRWASVGVVIAAMVAAQNEENGSATDAATPADDEVPELQPAPVAPSIETEVPAAPGPSAGDAPIRFDAGAVIGTGTTRGLGYGGLLRLSAALGLSPLFVVTSGTVTYSSNDFESRLSTGGAGLGTRLGSWHQALALELRAEALLQYVSVQATREGIDQSDQRWRGGGRLGGDGIWAMTPNWHWVAGVEATLLRPEVIVQVTSDTRTGSIPAVGWASTISLRFSD